MTRDTFEILKRALELPTEERVSLACSLIDSVDTAVDDSAESSWKDEINRRVRDLDSGSGNTVPWEEVQRKIAARLDRGRQAY